MKEQLKEFIIHGIDVICNLSKESTCFMKLWYLITLVRIISIYCIANDLYAENRDAFQCATKQFLCQTGCHDQFMPIKLSRFWTWHTHLMIISVLLMSWLRDSKMFSLVCGRTSIPTKTSNFSRHVCNLAQSTLLLGLELIFAYIYCQLLSKQYHPRENFLKLIESGELFFTPSVYMCQLEKTYTAQEERWYYDKENTKFRQSPAGLRVKAQLACAQSEPLCSIERSSEKTVVVLGMTLLDCLAIITLSFEVIYQLLRLSKHINKGKRQAVNQPVKARS